MKNEKLKYKKCASEMPAHFSYQVMIAYFTIIFLPLTMYTPFGKLPCDVVTL